MSAPLPDPGQRMTPLRKAAIVQAINSGAITLSEAARRWSLSAAELAEWQTAYRRGGPQHLRITHRRRKA